MYKLRTHQQEALTALQTTDKGRIVIPTGGGKTLVEAFALRDIINSKHQPTIHVVLAPRIALVNQLIKEYRDFIGQSYITLAFHSSRHEPDYQKVRWAEQATTQPQMIVTEFERAKSMGKDLVLFCTYASCEKLLGFKFSTLIADESQYCVSEGYFETVSNINADKKYFFTATEKHTPSDSGRGLNNTEVFGEVLYQVSPKQLIDEGYIVAPRLHIMEATTKNDSYTIVDECIQIAKKQQELSSHLPVCKTLFAMKGTDDVKTIVESIDKIKQALPSFRVFTIVSNGHVGAMVDGVKMARGNFMKELRETDNALIFHYDILSEGIDVDGITGVAILRNMNHSKLLQTIGRAVRVYKANPSAKKFAWVSVVNINDNEETASNITRVVKLIREGGFEVNVEEVEFTNSEGYGIADEDDLDDLVTPVKNAKSAALLEAVIHNIEQIEIIEEVQGQTVEQLVEEF